MNAHRVSSLFISCAMLEGERERQGGEREKAQIKLSRFGGR